jgi:hypothetical protein
MITSFFFANFAKPLRPLRLSFFYRKVRQELRKGRREKQIL